MKYYTWMAGIAALCATASAQSYDFALDTSLSTTDLSANLSLAMPANVRGTYDATNNPSGTQTCPGVFGSCSNVSILMINDLLAASQLSGVPTGDLHATVDTGNGLIVFSDVSIDALGGENGTADLTLDLLYMTFHTFQPTALYPGGFTVPVPLGQAAVSNVHFAQVGPPVTGTLTPSGIPQVYDIAALVPATLSLDVEFLGNPMTLGPIPVALPLVGSLDLGGGGAHLALFIDQSGQQTVPDPLGTQTFDDVPVDLPTVLPAGNTAHLLFNIDPGDLMVDLSATLGWYSTGVSVCNAQSYCVATPNTVGAGAHIASSGSSSLVANDLVLSCTGVPPLHPARFAIGSQQALSTLGDGVLCVGGTMRRFKVVFADAVGGISLPIDFLDPSQPVDLISAGSTWNFQLVYRDPLGGAATFNTSDALAVTFCP